MVDHGVHSSSGKDGKVTGLLLLLSVVALLPALYNDAFANASTWDYHPRCRAGSNTLVLPSSFVASSYQQDRQPRRPGRISFMKKKTITAKTVPSSNYEYPIRALSRSMLLRVVPNANEHELHQKQQVEHVGLYRKFATHAWGKLKETGLFEDDDDAGTSSYHYKVAPAKGFPDAMVQMTTRAMGPKKHTRVNDDTNLMRYARYALLETVPNITATASVPQDDQTSSSNIIHTSGIQVLNLVVFPSTETTLPVWGVDLVSLPGGKHLMLMDAHPMRIFTDIDSQAKDKDCSVVRYPHHTAFAHWHAQHVSGNNKNSDNEKKDWIFPWGGDVPTEVAKYVSPYALWTRLKEVEKMENDTRRIVQLIETDLFDAFCDHMELYLNLVQNGASPEKNDGDAIVYGSNDQSDYIEYRRSHDPAKPMLNSLYGHDFASRVLEKVLFPPTDANSVGETTL